MFKMLSKIKGQLYSRMIVHIKCVTGFW